MIHTDLPKKSGCGRGMNLLMTVEILNETQQIHNLQVYGVEYVPSSTKEANHILQSLLPNVGNATLGSPICRGDATNLDFVPSNSFDIAYTGKVFFFVQSFLLLIKHT